MRLREALQNTLDALRGFVRRFGYQVSCFLYVVLYTIGASVIVLICAWDGAACVGNATERSLGLVNDGIPIMRLRGAYVAKPRNDTQMDLGYSSIARHPKLQ